MVAPQTAGPVAAMQLAAPSPSNQPSRPATAGTQPYIVHPKGQPNNQPDADKDDPTARDDAYYSRRIAGDPSANFTMADAAMARAQAAQQLLGEEARAPSGPSLPSDGSGFSGPWTANGPNPILDVDRTPQGSFYAVSGRVSALAIRGSAPYTMYLGGAQGGVWISSTLTSQWIPKTDNAGSLAIGDIQLAPSNQDIVYVGTGEGNLSGDSYFGVGVLRSIDAGNTFTQVSGATFNEVSISKIAVNPVNPDVVYVATIRGRAGAKRVTPPNPTPAYGIFKSTNGGVTWTGVNTTTNQANGATDLVIDPQNANILYASFWGQGISKTVDGGAHWISVMNGFPADADFSLAPTRFALGISHPSAAVSATVYSGFEFFDNLLNYHVPAVWKTTDEGAHWTQTLDLGAAPDQVASYCANGGSSQCFYDNVIGVDPSNPSIVYALGLFNYLDGNGAGGIFRSTDGGDHWLNLGYGLHPDYHAIAFRRDSPDHILIGNDGGVWSSPDRGGRPSGTNPLSAVDWVDLNGKVDPATGDLLHSTGLQISQFDSVGANPTISNTFYGGLQDNGTLRSNLAPGVFPASYWADFSSGDGGQVNVDPTDPNYVYGNYFDISPYRFTDGMTTFFSNQQIQNGIDQNDRSDFYIPVLLDPANVNRLYLGTFRVYRTDNAKAANAGDVVWQPISTDLTSGCTGTAPNGARGCFISALGASAGGPALYTGSLDGLIYFTADATVASPHWTRVDIPGTTPARPVSAIAVDPSNYRVAYVAFNGFNAATPSTHGHVFKTIDAGQHWTDVSGNLPDNPVNSILIDPTHSNILYAGTDVGPLETVDGSNWVPLGTGFPVVNIWQLALNPYTRQIVAGTHGRGVWSLTDTVTHVPALQIRASSDGLPVGPNGLLTYTLTIENHGNITATAVTITDPVPANTTFISADQGGVHSGSNVIWSGLSVPLGTQANPQGGLAPGKLLVHVTVRFSGSLTTGQLVTNDLYGTTSVEGASANGSPYQVPVAPPNGVGLKPASQSDYARAGHVFTYQVTLQNLGFNADSYSLVISGNAWPTSLWNANFTSPVSSTGNVSSGGTFVIGVKVSVPAAATSGQQDTVSVKATSVSHPATTATATIQTTAVTRPILMVDEDGNAPDVSGIYAAALNNTGFPYDTWDLATSPTVPLGYLKAHNVLVWFTGQSYPDPLGPYETELASYLDSGGRLFLSGQDILDQAAGSAPFVLNYLHVNWDGTESHNDVGTASVSGVLTSPVTSGIGTLPLDFASLGFSDFADAIVPTAPAIPAFTLNPALGGKLPAGTPDALSVAQGNYKVVFLAFPYEVMGTPADRTNVMVRVLSFFGMNQLFLPIMHR